MRHGLKNVENRIVRSNSLLCDVSCVLLSGMVVWKGGVGGWVVDLNMKVGD